VNYRRYPPRVNGSLWRRFRAWLERKLAYPLEGKPPDEDGGDHEPEGEADQKAESAADLGVKLACHPAGPFAS